MSSLVSKTGSFKRARSNSSIFSEGTYGTDLIRISTNSQYECRTKIDKFYLSKKCLDV